MATPEGARSNGDGGSYHVLWEGLASGEYGKAVQLGGAADRSVHVPDTLGGGTLVWEGSLLLNPDETDANDWVVLTNGIGTALSFTGRGLEAVAPATGWIRPRRIGGTGAVRAILWARSNRR